MDQLLETFTLISLYSLIFWAGAPKGAMTYEPMNLFRLIHFLHFYIHSVPPKPSQLPQRPFQLPLWFCQLPLRPSQLPQRPSQLSRKPLQLPTKMICVVRWVYGRKHVILIVEYKKIIVFGPFVAPPEVVIKPIWKDNSHISISKCIFLLLVEYRYDFTSIQNALASIV